MDDSFSIVGLDRDTVCQEAYSTDAEISIKHFVFDDLLDTGESLVCKTYKVCDNFNVYLYLLRSNMDKFIKKTHENILGCFLGFLDGNVYFFEDFGFKITSFEKFTLLTEAVEYDSGRQFKFELLNLCDLPERLLSETGVSLFIFPDTISVLKPLDFLNQIAEDNRETLELALSGSEKAIEKLEREVGVEETEKLLSEFLEEPEKLLDTCVIDKGSGYYSITGIINSISSLTCMGRDLRIFDVSSENFKFKVISQSKISAVAGDRLKFNGKLYGVAKI